MEADGTVRDDESSIPDLATTLRYRIDSSALALCDRWSTPNEPTG